MTSSFDHASDDCNRRRGALLLRVSVGDYKPHRKTEWNPPPTEAGDIGDLVIFRSRNEYLREEVSTLGFKNRKPNQNGAYKAEEKARHRHQGA